jgi:dGTPase
VSENSRTGQEFGPRLAPYACAPSESRGRLYAEPESASRSCFQRDRDRVIHSAAFRRLKHKTQVFVYHEGDYYRTRLTHSIEVSQIARSISRSLGLNEDLAEALALAHDLGHTPFGHCGEDALDEAMRDYGGFDHNAQTLRILNRLEHRYAEFDGLNLTWETLEGVVKHNGPLIRATAGAREAIPESILAFDAEFPLDLSTWASAEAQVASLSDDIAYNNHDIDDGLRAGLFDVADLAPVPLAGPVFAAVAERHPGIERSRVIHESVRRLINAMVSDLLTESRSRLAALVPRSADDIRGHDQPVIAFSAAMAENDRALKRFLFTRMYRHDRVNAMTARGRQVVRELFDLYLDRPDRLPDEWSAGARGRNKAEIARIVCDYIAGMTDRYALNEHRRLFGADKSIAEYK